MPGGRPRQPVDLIIANGRKHLGKEEIERRREQEIKVPFDDVRPPEYLKSQKQVDEFNRYAGMLRAIGIFTELDVDCLARYIVSQDLYLAYTNLVMKQIKAGDVYASGKAQIQQDKAFRQCQACARELGLTVSSRCKLTVPQVDDEEDYEL